MGTCIAHRVYAKVLIDIFQNSIFEIELPQSEILHNFCVLIQVQQGCHPFLPLRTNRSVRFGFSLATVLQGSSGDQVSFKTTEGGVLLKDKLD